MAIHADQVVGLGDSLARVASVQAIGSGSTTLTAQGYNNPQIYGNTQSRSVTGTTLFTRSRRVGIMSFGNGNGAGANLVMAGAHGMGTDFQAVFVWGASEQSPVMATRSLVGFTTQTDRIDNLSPMMLFNAVGVGHEMAESNLSVYTNNGSGMASRVALGSSFPANTLSADLYRLVLTFAGAGTRIGYSITNLSTGVTSSGTLTAKLPALGVALTAQFYRNLTADIGVYPTFDFLHFATSGDL